jgi:hypothetical protein
MATSPHFWLQVQKMQTSPNFNRRSENGTWKPPKPLGSNVIAPNVSAPWYEFNNWRAQRIGTLNSPGNKKMYKAYSFYADQDRLWVWPSDATLNKVGDGRPGGPTDDDSDSEDTSDEEDDPSAVTDDWSLLSFSRPIEHDPYPNARRSYAMTRGSAGRIGLQAQNSTALRELLPDRYLAVPGNSTAQPGQGGMIGELPILIALVALSVVPGEVDWALANCFRPVYVPHQGARGQGVHRQGCKEHVLRAMSCLHY